MVTAVRVKGDKLGKDFTVSREPHAKIPDANRPNVKPKLIEDSPRVTPAANAPPKRTKATANKKRALNRRPSSATSKPTAKIGIAAAAKAAVVASVIA